MRKGLLTTLHNHTTFSDGENTVEETIKTAIDKGFSGVGISDHGYISTYTSIGKDSLPEYISAIRNAAAKFPEIEVYAGVETEYLMPWETKGVDYIIGSVHNLKYEGKFYAVDGSIRAIGGLSKAVPRFVKIFFDTVAEMAEKQKPDIIGHLDLITKYNANKEFFDSECAEYLSCVKVALDAIRHNGCILEVNTGGMSRGLTKEPYPEWHILKEACKMGIPVTVSSDSHCARNLDFAFAETAEKLKEIGFKSTRQLIKGSFEDVGL